MRVRADREWSDLALEALAGDGRRAGAARRAIVEELARHDCCVSAQELVERLRSGGRRTGPASVYRALDMLDGAGLVQRVDVGDGGARFEAVVPGGEHHHHAVCDRCGLLTPFSDEGLERAIHRLGDRLAHRVRAHDVLIRGECERCARE